MKSCKNESEAKCARSRGVIKCDVDWGNTRIYDYLIADLQLLAWERSPAMQVPSRPKMGQSIRNCSGFGIRRKESGRKPKEK